MKKELIQACEGSGQYLANHFVAVNKMVVIGSGASKEIKGMALDRYAPKHMSSTPPA